MSASTPSTQTGNGVNPSAGGFTVSLSSARFLDASMLDESPQSPVPLAPASKQAEEIPVVPAEKSESEPCVQAYMSQLMNRQNGGSPSIQTPAPPFDTRAGNTGSASEKIESHQTTTVVLEAPLTAEEFIPKKFAPESNADMCSLRKLANDSTRSAITSFAAKQKKSKLFASLAIVSGGIVFSGVMFCMSQSVGDLAFNAGIACALLSIFAATNFLLKYRSKATA